MARRYQYQRYTNEQRMVVMEEAVRTSVSEAAAFFDVPVSTVRHWVKQHGEKKGGGRLGKRKKSGRKGIKSPRQKKRKKSNIRKRGAARRYTPSQIDEILNEVRASSITQASKKHKVSRSTIYDWQRKEAQAADGKRKPLTEGPSPGEVETQRDREILNEWHKQPGLGPSQIRNQLRRRAVKVSVQTVRRVMEEAGYRPPKVRNKPHDERYETIRPNQLWHLDFTHRFIHRARTFTLILLDDFSRYVVGHGVTDAERASVVTSTFESACRRHGRPEMVIHDKGSAFWAWRGISRFTKLLTEMGIDQIPAQHKEWNGKLEVFNKNLHKELYDVHRFATIEEMQQRLAEHLDWYNYHRTNHALGGLLVPADRYHGRSEKMLKAIEAGCPHDGIGEPVPASDRLLDILRVTSNRGQVQIHLMGQRLWPSSPK